MQTAALAFASAACLAFAYFRLRRYLHIFQQEEYDGGRFFNWLVSARTFDKRLSAALLALTVIAWIAGHPWLAVTLALAGVVFGAVAYLEPNPEKAAKKKLVMTHRAKRIFATAFALSGLLVLLIAVTGASTIWTLPAFILLVQVLPGLLVAANWLLKPVEKNIQDGFRLAAERRLQAVAPKVVGITGSFGKTSVKHILGHILEMTTNTLYTPGSVNTVMGISRIINERLEDNCRYFLVEMGAYGIGSIARLCKFTPPDHGIITSIGAAHYERFKDLDSVAHAKFELAEAVEARDGKLVVHESVLAQPYARSFVDKNRKHVVVVGESADADVRILSVTQKRDGLHVEISRNGETYTLFAPLFGRHHGHNMALAFTFATTMGLNAKRVVQALRSTPQITHRLELKSHPSGALYLDDAYNSNPDGFANALELADGLKREGGRRILVTPGMAELGAKHDDAHAEIGRRAAHTTDVTLAVRPERIPTFLAAFRQENTGAELIECARFADAKAWLDANLGPADIVLIENDLPDLYERVFVT